MAKETIPSSQEKTKILVIDDERLIRLTLSAKLKLIGYTTVCVSSPQEAVVLLNDGGYKQFQAVITDIMMGEFDGFLFRDILRGMDPTMPIFFITALDPEEGSGFLKRIMDDSSSFYLPKSIKAELLLKRVQRLVDSRRIEQFIQEQTKEVKDAMELASHLQRNMLPPRIALKETYFYTTWWLPKETVSGDLYEIIPLNDDGNVFILGDVQGHGESAALSMMAVQSYLKNLSASEDMSNTNPARIANLIQNFFARNLGAFSYMTALICIHKPKEGIVEWISCGAPDLNVIDPLNPDNIDDINPEKRGGLPIGLVEDTVYTMDDVVTTRLSDSSICIAYTDGVLDIYKDDEGYEPMPSSLRKKLRNELLADARMNGSIITAPYKFLQACMAYGYTFLSDDITELIFGGRFIKSGVLEKVIRIDADAIDNAAQDIDKWCIAQGWPTDIINKILLVFEEKLMNLHDHGFDIRERSNEHASIRLRKNAKNIELTIWDNGTQEPSIEVAAGNPDVAFELKNRNLSERGRGRLLVREICNGIQRNRFGLLNETTYFIPMENKEQ